MKSILQGIFWGAVLCGAGLLALNHYAPAPGPVVVRGATGGTVQGAGDGAAAVAAPADDGAGGRGTDVATGSGEGAAEEPSAGDKPATAVGAETAALAPDEAGRPSVQVTPGSTRNSAIADLLGPQIPIAGPALEINSRDFEGGRDTALLSIVLYRDGSAPIPADAVGAMTMPLTLAIDPGRPEDLRIARSAKQMGHEILAVLPLAVESAFVPEGLTSGDGAAKLEVGTAETLVKLNMAVGAVAPDGAEVLDMPDAMSALLKPVAAHSFIWVEPRASSRSAAALLAARSDLLFVQANVFVAPGSGTEDVLIGLEDAAAQARALGTSVIFIEASQAALRVVVEWGIDNGGRDVIFAPISAIVRKRGRG